MQLANEIASEITPKTMIEERKTIPKSIPTKPQQREFVHIPRRERHNRIKYIEMVDCSTQTK